MDSPHRMTTRSSSSPAKANKTGASPQTPAASSTAKENASAAGNAAASLTPTVLFGDVKLGGLDAPDDEDYVDEVPESDGDDDDDEEMEAVDDKELADLRQDAGLAQFGDLALGALDDDAADDDFVPQADGDDDDDDDEELEELEEISAAEVRDLKRDLAKMKQ